MKIEQNIREAFDACAKVRNEKAKLYGNAWRVAHFYTLVNMIRYKMGSVSPYEGEDLDQQREVFTAAYNYALFAFVQYCNCPEELHVLKEEEPYIAEAVAGLDSEVRELVAQRSAEYGDAWMCCPLFCLSDTIDIKIARISHLYFRATKDEECSTAILDALRDIAGYTILCRARVEMLRRKVSAAVENFNAAPNNATTQTPKQ